jgi:hypothetical protein
MTSKRNDINLNMKPMDPPATAIHAGGEQVVLKQPPSPPAFDIPRPPTADANHGQPPSCSTPNSDLPPTLSATDQSSTTNYQMGMGRAAPPNNHQPTAGADHDQANMTKRHNHQLPVPPWHITLVQRHFSNATNRLPAQPHNTSSQAPNLCRER